MISRHETKLCDDVDGERSGNAGDGMARQKSENFSTGMIENSRSGAANERRDLSGEDFSDKISSQLEMNEVSELVFRSQLSSSVELSSANVSVCCCFAG